ncbi:M42 family metallopeptidase [Sedimentibacter sp. B4]|uniref:M42 family metallopeptidase n=1 Tax=Sedimentibacter sp. B4 TaxID=304766 RepID=UPI000302E319|nr:M42 family peptidase [Sedimentibacter sp. B4]
MDKKNTLKMIADISNANGTSGFEDLVVNELRKYSSDLGTIKEDTLRNLYVYRKGNKGNRPIVQLDAHSDEVGFMVQAIRPNGTLQIIPIGGWINSNIPAHKVWVRNSECEYILGITSSKPPHFMTEKERRNPLDIYDITVDVGATSKEEATDKFKIRIGEPICPAVSFEYIDEHDLMIGKSFDCRLGCASIISTLKELENVELNVDIVGATASQEEVGVRGATLTANTVKPDIAIVFEGCPADDTVVPEYEIQTAIKKGPMLRHIDSKMITNPRFQRFALDLCKKNNIPAQESVRKSGSTNGAAIHLSNKGVPTIVIGIPVRYAHTHFGISSYEDYANGVALACEIIKSLDVDVLNKF